MEDNELIYGLDPNGSFTTIDVRDAIIRCFFQAHNKEIEKIFKDLCFQDEQQSKEFKQQHTELLIRTFFNDVNADFDHPTKQSLIDVVNKCKQFAQSFRDQTIIEENAALIQTLIDNSKEEQP